MATCNTYYKSAFACIGNVILVTDDNVGVLCGRQQFKVYYQSQNGVLLRQTTSQI